LTTSHSSFELENKGHARYFAVAAWLSNFCRGFSNSLGTFSSKIKSLQKRYEALRIGEEGEKKWQQANSFMLCHGRPGFIDFFKLLPSFGHI